MSVLEIVQNPSPVLRRRAEPVARVTKRIAKLIRDMADTMYAANGVGLAAPQIGQSIRVIVVDAGEGLVTIVNPEIIDRKGSATDVEGCLSIPGVSGYVTRAAGVTVLGLDAKGRALKMEAEGLLARALQHEIDHLDGILFIDRATGITGRQESFGTEDAAIAASAETSTTDSGKEG